MRILICLSALLLLSGCDAIVRHDGDYFEASGRDIGRYEMDAQACGVVADDFVTYDVHGMGGTTYDRNRAYNGIFGRCMASRGYVPRAYPENWLN